MGVWTKGQTGVLGLISHVTWTMDHSLTIYHTDNPYSLEVTVVRCGKSANAWALYVRIVSIIKVHLS